MPWTITFEHSSDREPVATFANVPDVAGDKILAFILPIVRAAEQAAHVAKSARMAAASATDPYRPAIDALVEIITRTTDKKTKKKGRRS